jgi:hypothetical protein
MHQAGAFLIPLVQEVLPVVDFDGTFDDAEVVTKG